MPFPTYTVGPNPPDQQNQGDLWFDTTNGVLNVQNGTSFTPITVPQRTANMNASAITGNQPLAIPAVTGSLGASINPPAGHVWMAYDMANNRMWTIGSGGATFKSVAFA